MSVNPCSGDYDPLGNLFIIGACIATTAVTGAKLLAAAPLTQVQ